MLPCFWGSKLNELDLEINIETLLHHHYITVLFSPSLQNLVSVEATKEKNVVLAVMRNAFCSNLWRKH